MKKNEEKWKKMKKNEYKFTSLFLEINDHLCKLKLRSHMRIQGHFLGHFSNDHFADIIILEGIVLMTGFSFFGIANGAVAHSVFVSAFIEFQSFFSESFFSEDQTILITIGVEVDNT